MSPLHFRAPWSRSLKTRTAMGVLLLIAFEVVILLIDLTQPLRFLIAAVPPFALIASVAQGIRGYVLTEGELQILRWGWITRVPLTDLRDAEGKAGAIQYSIRIFANRGLLAFTGFYWSRELKLFRAFATDDSRSVVLRFERKRVVVSPHDPQQFIVRTRTMLKNRQFPM